jgi:hypothetical protein
MVLAGFHPKPATCDGKIGYPADGKIGHPAIMQWEEGASNREGDHIPEADGLPPSRLRPTESAGGYTLQCVRL